MLSLAFAGEGQHQDTGARCCIIRTPAATSCRNPLRVAVDGRHRGLVQVNKGARIAFQREMRCAACRYDQPQRRLPYVDIREDEGDDGATKPGVEGQRKPVVLPDDPGLTEDEAMAMVVRSYVNRSQRELPMEYAPPLNRLIELQMEGAVTNLTSG